MGDNHTHSQSTMSSRSLQSLLIVGACLISSASALDLYQFDGSPIQPMYLAFTPPKMLPTITMNPTTASAGKKAKRTAGADPEADHGYDVPLNKDAIHMKRDFEQPLLHRVDLNMVWWTGVGMTLFGGVAYLL